MVTNLDNQAGGVRLEERGVFGDVIHFQHNASLIGLELRHTDFLQQSVVYIEALAHQRPRQSRVGEVEENSLWAIQTLRVELNPLLKVDSHARAVGRGPVTKPSDVAESAALFSARGISGRFGIVGRGGFRTLARSLFSRRRFPSQLGYIR